MTPTETTKLCRIARAACPAQAVDEYTPDAWHLLLGDLDFTTAQVALIEVAKRQPFVAPAEIRAEVHRRRRARLEVAGTASTPPRDLDPDDVPAYLAWLADVRRRIADGHTPDTTPTVERRRDVVAELGHVGKEIS